MFNQGNRRLHTAFKRRPGRERSSQGLRKGAGKPLADFRRI